MNKILESYEAKEQYILGKENQDVINKDKSNGHLMHQAYIRNITNIDWVKNVVIPLADKISVKIDRSYDICSANNKCSLFFLNSEDGSKKVLTLNYTDNKLFYKINSKRVNNEGIPFILKEVPNSIEKIVNLLAVVN